MVCIGGFVSERPRRARNVTSHRSRMFRLLLMSLTMTFLVNGVTAGTLDFARDNPIGDFDVEVEAAERRIAVLEGELNATQSEAAELGQELEEALQALEAVLQASAAEAEAQRQELVAAQGRIAALEVEVHTAEQRIAFLEGELKATQSEAAEMARELAEARLAQEAVSTGQKSDPIQSQDTVDVDSLITNPAAYQGRDVVVTGSILHLLERYRLQSHSGTKSLVVEVVGVPRSDLLTFERAIDVAGLLGEVRVRIRGRVDGDSQTTFHLVATDLMLAE